MPKAKTQIKKITSVQKNRTTAKKKKLKIVSRKKKIPARKKRSVKKTKAAATIKASSSFAVSSALLPTPLPVVAPISMSASAIPSGMPTAAGNLPNASTYSAAESPVAYKELPPRQSRLQLWLAVLACTVIIVVFWLYLAQRNFKQLPNTFSESIKNTQVDALVNDLQQNYSELQDNMGAISNIASQADQQNANMNTNVTTPADTNNELNNLFSDLQ